MFSLGKAIDNAAYQIHKELGPGLLEKVYFFLGVSWCLGALVAKKITTEKRN